ncbi:uncharacterized protein BCR38DRAFT_408143 [Pseudomassariella vexata]|uniref:Uncharacterized protein n=1 Tax=Pseudomassariella vexata TaxID=1141098 RepID=A0A1Y2E3P5_9PEZI|nr:uncharacterized protein BCR38DRAFT_408143 [Pseudomassariella vexata]ORY66178.1 hypothetical protein BCR38DRAFT_408143 [Pseudomassariella vexata]
MGFQAPTSYTNPANWGFQYSSSTTVTISVELGTGAGTLAYYPTSTRLCVGIPGTGKIFWKIWHLTQPEVQTSLSHVFGRYSLRKPIQLRTDFLGGDFDEIRDVLTAKTLERGDTLMAQCLIAALAGRPGNYIPDIKGLEMFKCGV